MLHGQMLMLQMSLRQLKTHADGSSVQLSFSIPAKFFFLQLSLFSMYEGFPYSVFALNKYFSLQYLAPCGGICHRYLEYTQTFIKSIPPEIIFAIFSVNVRMNIIPPLT